MAIDNELSEAAKPRSLLGGLKGLGLGLLILTLIFVIMVFWHQGRMASKLQETLAELDRTDPGWRWEDIEAARAELPEDENSARVVVVAAQQMPQLPQRWPSADFPDKDFRSLAPNEMLSGENFVLLSKELASARAALATASKLADMPRGRHRIQYRSDPISIPLPHLQESRNLVTLLGYEAMRRSQRGDSKNALTSGRAALNVARSIGDEPFYVSQLVRGACISNVCQTIERILGQGEPSPEDLSVLQKMLEAEDGFPSLLIATRGERATLHKAFELVERGQLPLRQLEGYAGGKPTKNWLQSIGLSFWRMDTREDNALFLSLMNRRLKEIQRPIQEQVSLEKGFDEEARALPKNAMITRLLLPIVSKMGEAFRREHADLRSTMAALAAERYRREKKAWPESIDRLCPQYLTDVPIDPYDGKPLRYKRALDGVIIYSVGQDGVDSGGNLDRERLSSPGVDFGFRLWDVPKRRQPPRPKTSEEQPR